MADNKASDVLAKMQHAARRPAPQRQQEETRWVPPAARAPARRPLSRFTVDLDFDQHRFLTMARMDLGARSKADVVRALLRVAAADPSVMRRLHVVLHAGAAEPNRGAEVPGS